MCGLLSHLDASPEQILMCNECEFCELDSDEVMCFFLVSVVSGLVFVTEWKSDPSLSAEYVECR